MKLSIVKKRIVISKMQELLQQLLLQPADLTPHMPVRKRMNEFAEGGKLFGP